MISMPQEELCLDKINYSHKGFSYFRRVQLVLIMVLPTTTENSRLNITRHYA